LLVVEEILISLIPYFLGIAVDSLLNNKNTDFYTYIFICLASVSLAVIRRGFDTRVYTKIWQKISSEKIKTLAEEGVERSKIVSRSHMFIEYTKFFEHHVPAGISSVIDIIISLGMLFFFLPLPAFFVLILIILSYFIQHHTSFIHQKIDRDIQIYRERMNEEVLYKDSIRVEPLLNEQGKLLVRSSDIDAGVYGIHELIANLAEIIFVVAMVNNSFTTGAIMANLTYVYKAFSKISIFGCVLVGFKCIKNYDKFLKPGEDCLD
jgi:hypothetical protein